MRQQCPKCGKGSVARTRVGGRPSSREFAGLKAGFENEYKCPDCGNQWNTIEVLEADLVALAADVEALVLEVQEVRALVTDVLSAEKPEYRLITGLTDRIEGKGEDNDNT